MGGPGLFGEPEVDRYAGERDTSDQLCALRWCSRFGSGDCRIQDESGRAIAHRERGDLIAQADQLMLYGVEGQRGGAVAAVAYPFNPRMIDADLGEGIPDDIRRLISTSAFHDDRLAGGRGRPTDAVDLP